MALQQRTGRMVDSHSRGRYPNGSLGCPMGTDDSAAQHEMCIGPTRHFSGVEGSTLAAMRSVDPDRDGDTDWPGAPNDVGDRAPFRDGRGFSLSE